MKSVSVSGKPIWTPSQQRINDASVTRFIKAVNFAHSLTLKDFHDLYEWSIQEPVRFWQAFWSFASVMGDQGEPPLLDQDADIEKARFFPNGYLNFAENLLRRKDNGIAIEFFGEDKVHRKISYKNLYDETSQLSQIFKGWGLKSGDRVAGYLPNMPETIISMLATASCGAIWTACSPDFGASGVLDRFSQVEPKILVTVDGYYYSGKFFNCLDRLPEILKGLPSVEKVIVVPYQKEEALPHSYVSWASVLQEKKPKEIKFERFAFNHPLYIMFTSGTTGKPKCIVHGAGGTLLQQMKEHQLHCDIRPDDVVFYFTTCSWMMWHWLVAALASEARIILYDGNPMYPHASRLFDIADQCGITLFGTSAKFIDALVKARVYPARTHDLRTIRTITSTGSPLVPEGFDYIYNSVKKDVCLSSISGGTDIISCFALGNSTGPVYRGELQTRGLGMAVSVFNDQGKPVVGQKGELVCTQPFPSQPLGFWGDIDGTKYHEAYFNVYPNIWHHGDFVELTDHEGMVFYGRSDAILNPGGIRIGTAEIYRQVEQIDEVVESLATGQEFEGDERIILFVKLREGIVLGTDLIDLIKRQIRNHTTPRHVPAKIIQVPDIPRTKNGKIAEIAVREMIHARPIRNKEALANPECLEAFKDRPELVH